MSTHNENCRCEGLGVTVGDHGGPAECPGLWWHMYGGTTESGGIWMAVVAGGSGKHPDDVSTDPMILDNAFDLGPAELHYLGSWDHEPTEEEKEALTPEKYRDEVPG